MTRKARKIRWVFAEIGFSGILLTIYPVLSEQLRGFLPGSSWDLFSRFLTIFLLFFLGFHLIPEFFRIQQEKPDGSHERIKK